jgi:spermidine synthase
VPTHEIAWAPTARGELSLRQWSQPAGPGVGYEITLNRICVTSSRFAVGAAELTRRALAGLSGQGWHVALAGLGLGFTAAAVLDDRRVADLLILEATRDITDWARQGLTPDGARVLADRRTRVREAPFPAPPESDGSRPSAHGRRHDAVIVDVAHWSNAEAGGGYDAFRSVAHVRRVADMLRPGGILALWSDVPPDTALLRVLRGVFADVVARPLAFETPGQGVLAVHTHYVARTAG